MNPLEYFSQQGAISDPGEYGYLFDGLPRSIPELVRVVQGVTLHVHWATRYGFPAPPERMGELQLRTIKKRLAATLALDGQPLNVARPLDKKLLGNCRDFSVLLASMLRRQGIPARARCGFGAYFMPDHFEDHWVTEYWNREQERWILVDAQLDALQCEVMKIDFDPLDVPLYQFITGGQAWQMCHAGADPDKFGIFDMHGLDFVRANLVRDIASLNKAEMLPWDCWGIISEESLAEPAGLALLNKMAALSAEDAPEWPLLRDGYRNETRLRMDGRVFNAVMNETDEIPLE